MRAAIAEATSTFIEMNTGSLAIFVTIRRALAGCTPGAASTKTEPQARCTWGRCLLPHQAFIAERPVGDGEGREPGPSLTWTCKLRYSPQSAAPRHLTWNKTSELAFVVEDHRILGGGYAALAIFIGNLRWHRDRNARRGAKLSLVRGLQWRQHGRRRHELRVHDIPTMPGDCSWDWRLLRAEYAIPAPTGPTSIQQDGKALSTLNGHS
jgi:hypothetical protein